MCGVAGFVATLESRVTGHPNHWNQRSMSAVTTEELVLPTCRRRLPTRRQKSESSGLGYVGLPLISAFTNAGFQCLGFDVDPRKGPTAARSRTQLHQASGIGKGLPTGCSVGVLDPTNDMSRLAEADALLICVPTPLNASRDPDSAVYRIHCRGDRCRVAARTVGRPGKHDLPDDDARRHGPHPESQFRPASSAVEMSSSPSVRSARIRATRTTPRPEFRKLSAASMRHSSELASALYAHAIVKVVRVANAEIAEACKILENTYRAVNIALVNELKTLFDRMGIDIWQVVDAGKDQAFRIPGVLSRTRPRRTLHPDRSVLSELAGPHAGHEHTVHRTGRRSERRNAAVRGGTAIRIPERQGQAHQRQQDMSPGHGLQERRR
jgi:hypothetical protein